MLWTDNGLAPLRTWENCWPNPVWASLVAVRRNRSCEAAVERSLKHLVSNLRAEMGSNINWTRPHPDVTALTNRYALAGVLAEKGMFQRNFAPTARAEINALRWRLAGWDHSLRLLDRLVESVDASRSHEHIGHLLAVLTATLDICSRPGDVTVDRIRLSRIQPNQLKRWQEDRGRPRPLDPAMLRRIATSCKFHALAESIELLKPWVEVNLITDLETAQLISNATYKVQMIKDQQDIQNFEWYRSVQSSGSPSDYADPYWHHRHDSPALSAAETELEEALNLRPSTIENRPSAAAVIHALAIERANIGRKRMQTNSGLSALRSGQPSRQSRRFNFMGKRTPVLIEDLDVTLS